VYQRSEPAVNDAIRIPRPAQVLDSTIIYRGAYVWRLHKSRRRLVCICSVDVRYLGVPDGLEQSTSAVTWPLGATPMGETMSLTLYATYSRDETKHGHVVDLN
jgi:hypothetical protein